MLVGMNASGAGIPAEHAVVLACALRDHLVACCHVQADFAEPSKQRKKRKEKGAPAGDSAQVRSRPWLSLRCWQSTSKTCHLSIYGVLQCSIELCRAVQAM